MDRSRHVHNDPSAFTGLCITIGMLAQSLASGIIPVLASSVSALMKSPIPSVVSKQSLDPSHTVKKKKSQMIISSDTENVTRLIFAHLWWVLCKHLSAFHGLDSLRAVSPVTPLGWWWKAHKKQSISGSHTHAESRGCHGSPAWMEERFNGVQSAPTPPPPGVRLWLEGVAVGVAEAGVAVSVIREGKEMSAFTLKMTAEQPIKGTF